MHTEIVTVTARSESEAELALEKRVREIREVWGRHCDVYIHAIVAREELSAIGHFRIKALVAYAEKRQ